jgi:hypothetical protein
MLLMVRNHSSSDYICLQPHLSNRHTIILTFITENRPVLLGKRVGYNNMIYGEDEIARIARVAGEYPAHIL